ncbi:MAG: Eco57I restriction-modification methylase domain-containing protein [Verrucomicrobia bacterium]|nr:Eco57I restriction-modification methylase domain-containing protein [Verrucomicrobiota bacterium]
MPDLHQKLSELLSRYARDRERTLTEADVGANYVDILFFALGWDILNPTEYNRQRYVREAGYADIGLLIKSDPKLFVEIKRFGVIPKSAERRGDRTSEERQAFKYARQEKIRWAILTNFERLHVFDADQERLILAFDDPQDFSRRLEDLNCLTRASIERDSLEHFAALQVKGDIDHGFLENLKRWRQLLAQNIFELNAANEAISTEGKPDLDKLRRVVQRILDRLVIIRFADDRELLDNFGVIEAMLDGFKARRSYAAEGKLYRDFLEFCGGMDRKHNTEIFSPKHPCELVAVGNDCLEQLFDEITAISFRKFTSDILGNTYESYLGHRLKLDGGKIALESHADLRRSGGIYYTPPSIVRYIVDNTLGEKLKELEVQHGFAAGHEARKMKILDPACGSGSFLIYAFDVLAAFYARCNKRITAEQVRLVKESKASDMLESRVAIKSLPPLLLNYPKIVLEENLYGVDLDEEAAEMASVNLIMKAFSCVSSNGRKLPLILNQNIKIGNSLIGCLGDAELWKKTPISVQDSEHLVTLRRKILATGDDTAKRKLLEETEEKTRRVAEPLYAPLKKFFSDPAAKHPFHWTVEFPEVFDRQGAGFDVIIGNPPYVSVTRIPADDRVYLLEFYQTAEGRFDLYITFLERGFSLLCEAGRISFINPVKFAIYANGRKLRQMMLRDYTLEEIVDISQCEDVFADPSTYPCLLRVRKSAPPTDHEIALLRVTAKKCAPVLASIASSTFSHRSAEGILRVPDAIISTNPNNSVDAIVEKMSRQELRLGAWLTIEQCIRIGGREARQRLVVAEKDLRQLSPAQRGECHPMLDGEHLDRYRIDWDGSYLRYKPSELYNPKSKELLESPKILVKRVAVRLSAVPDDGKQEGFFYPLNTIYALVPKPDCRYSMLFLTALLNSVLLDFAYKQQFRAISVRGGYVEFREYLKHLSLPRLDLKQKAAKAAHDELANLAKKILRLHWEAAKVERAFAAALNNHPHERKPLGDTYWNRPGYVPLIEKKSLVKASDLGEIAGLRCEMVGNTVRIDACLADDWKPSIEMNIADDKLRHFIFYGIRQFLRVNTRKRKWGDGKILETILDEIQVPMFQLHRVYDHETHLNTLQLVLAEMKKESPLCNLSDLERDIADTDREIDQLVYRLYGLSPEEIQIVENQK